MSNAEHTKQPIGLELRARLEDFLTAYALTIDDGDVDGWPAYFHADGFYQITTRENHEANRPIGLMLCESRAMMEDRMLALRTANIFEPHTYCHILGRPLFEAGAEGRVKCRSNFSVLRTMQDGRTEQFAAGKYIDEIAVDGSEPAFMSRRVVLESRRVDILIVFPL